MEDASDSLNCNSNAFDWLLYFLFRLGMSSHTNDMLSLSVKDNRNFKLNGLLLFKNTPCYGPTDIRREHLAGSEIGAGRVWDASTSRLRCCWSD